jgi:N-acetylglucosamine-6-sulfatase
MADHRIPCRGRALAALTLAAPLTLACALAGGCGSGSGTTQAATPKHVPVDPRLQRRTAGGPNFLIILLDDQAQNSFKARYEPQTFRWIVRPGTNFRNGLAAPPLCCPDRAGFLTGEYPHSSGVFSNHPGYPTLRDKGNTLPVWLARAGYTTALVGKYLNHYYGAEGATPAPGWDLWFAQTNREQYYDYPVSVNGTVRHYGSNRRDYSTDVFTRRALSFIEDRSRSRHPFFLWLTLNAPHGVKDPGPGCGNHNPAPPDRRTLQRFRDARLPRSPAFDEANVSDKPRAISRLPRIDRRDLEHIQRGWRCTLATLSAADRDVGRLMTALRRSGALDNTIVAYLSDNGFYFGEHRIFSGKQYPYEPGLRVPMAIRVPARYRERAQPGISDQVVDEQDLTATLLRYARVPPCPANDRCRRIDGRPLQPLLGGAGRWPAGRGVLAEIKADQGQYAAIRTRRWAYVRYDDGERELYDLRNDPDELRNLARSGRFATQPADIATVKRRLAARLERLRRCSGARGIARSAQGKPLCE